jgi:hypothetical protein
VTLGMLSWLRTPLRSGHDPFEITLYTALWISWLKPPRIVHTVLSSWRARSTIAASARSSVVASSLAMSLQGSEVDSELSASDYYGSDVSEQDTIAELASRFTVDAHADCTLKLRTQ